ncbi:MAG: hypothetical protein J5838_03030 [Desulfovibrio sp.]|nr:hypothetical protein [Desulfovibrio sp.]
MLLAMSPVQAIPERRACVYALKPMDLGKRSLQRRAAGTCFRSVRLDGGTGRPRAPAGRGLAGSAGRPALQAAKRLAALLPMVHLQCAAGAAPCGAAFLPIRSRTVTGGGLLNMKLKCSLLFSALLACALAAGEAWADVKIDEANFPDAAFRQWVKKNVANGGDVLTDRQIAAAERLELVGQDIASFKGLEHFAALQVLFCSGNSLTALDISKNLRLRELDCANCGLKALDVSRNKNLEALNCSGNTLAKLDISSNIALKWLNCSGNSLKSIDASKNIALQSLLCENNKIKILDLSKNKELIFLECQENPLKTVNLLNNRNIFKLSLPEKGAVTLPGGDTLSSRDFAFEPAGDKTFRLDLSRFGDKVEDAYVLDNYHPAANCPQAQNGVYFFPAGALVGVAYRIGKEGETMELVFNVPDVPEEEEK